MIGVCDAAWLGRVRAQVSARRALAAVVLALVAVTAAWDTLNPARSSPVTVLYVGAADCPPCHAWQRGDGNRFRTSAQFAQVIFREVNAPTLRNVLNDEYWPDDLCRYRNQLGRHAGVPLWIIAADGEVLERGFGASEWRSVIWPRIQALTR